MDKVNNGDVKPKELPGLENGTLHLEEVEVVENKTEIPGHEGSWRSCCFKSIWPFTLYFGVVSLSTSVMTSYLTSQVTILEKQFRLSSSQSGVLLSMNEAGVLTSVLVASYLGRNAHIPRVLGVCGILYGAAAVTCIIPHFFAQNILGDSNFETNSEQNVSSSDNILVCSPERPGAPSLGDTSCTGEDKQFTRAMFMAMLLISLGMFIQGMVNSAKIPLAQIYIDDNVPTMKSGLHIGIIVSLSVFGPAISYAVGGFVSQVYVTLEETDMTPRDPRWVGAWWLGFLGFGCLAAVLSAPLLLFPKSLPIDPPKSVSPDNNSADSDQIFLKRIINFMKGVSRPIIRLVKRPVYVCIVLGTAFRFFTIAGVLAFRPKYLQIHYGLSVYKSNLLIGFAGVGGSATGILLSGLLIRVLKLDTKGMIKTLITTTIIASLLFTSGIFLECPQPHIRDFEMNMAIQSKEPISVSMDVSKYCFSRCNCDAAKFFPVCGVDDVTYFSPCHAGCQTSSGTGFTDCLCVSNCTNSRVDPESNVVPGMCHDECPLYMIFVVLQCLGNFISGLGNVPATLALLRSVDDADKLLALGGNFFVSSLMGWFLGPIVMGAVIDTTCTVWNSSCSEDGSCAVYDVADLRNKLHGVLGGVSVVYLSLFILAYLSLVYGKNEKLYINQNKETEIKPPTNK